MISKTKIMLSAIILVPLLVTLLVLLLIHSNILIIAKGQSMGGSYGGIYIADPTVTTDDISDGDVIKFNNKCGQNVVHRLYYLNKSLYDNGEIYDGYKTKGDGNEIYDYGDCYGNHKSKDTIDLKAKIIFGLEI